MNEQDLKKQLTGLAKRSKMNEYILPEWNDKLFFYGRRLVHEQAQRTWHLTVVPEDCLAGYEAGEYGLPTLSDLRRQKPGKTLRGETRKYEGRILFSAGVILIINDKIVLAQRTADAAVDPLKWTCPAGRCDGDPGRTALKEFYEELVVLDGCVPIFIDFGHRELADIYRQTLIRISPNVCMDSDEWSTMAPDELPGLESLLSTVRTTFGDEVFNDRFMVYWDEPGNVLEMRHITALRLPPEIENRIILKDGERDRPVKLFPMKEFLMMEPSVLVPAMAYFQTAIKKIL